MRYTLMTSVAAMTLALATTTLAQDATATAEPLQDEAVGLEDIIVTAQRRSESLQRAAVAVSAVSGEDLVNAGVTETTALTRLVPSLVVQPAGSNTTFYLRGVGTLAANAYAENPIAYNVGGVNYGRPTAPNGSFFDLERIEVVKGPQGTLYGRNATGGAINILPNRPNVDDLQAQAIVEAGNYSHRKFGGMLNIPLEGNGGLRLAFQDVERDGYMSDGYDDENSTSARLSLLVRPSESWSVLLSADYFDQGGKGVGSVTVPSDFYPVGPAPENRIGGSDPRSTGPLRGRFPLVAAGLISPPRDDGFLDNKFWGLTATIEAKLGFGTLTVIPAYRKSQPDLRFYSTGFRGDIDETVDQFSLEARLASTGDGPLQYVVGAFLFNEDQEAINSFFQGNLSLTYFEPSLTTESRAIFGQATYALTDTFRLVAGGRYTTEEKTQDTPFQQSASPVPIGPFIQITGALDFDSFTYKAGVEFDAGPTSLLYANVSTGFKSGGFYASVRDNTYDPEELTAYTLGAKNRFFDNRLQLNVEGFWWDYKDQQISYSGPILANTTNLFTQANVTTNVGDATIKGVEVDGRFQILSGGVLSANIQYLDAVYDSFVYRGFSPQGAPPRTTCAFAPETTLPVAPPARVFNIDCSGRPAINAPEWSMNLGYEQTVDLSSGFTLIAGARARIETSRFLSIEYLPEEEQEGYTTTDAYLTLESPDARWTATAFVNNIEDETIYSTSFPRPILGVVYNGLRPPRTYGLRLTARY